MSCPLFLALFICLAPGLEAGPAGLPADRRQAPPPDAVAIAHTPLSEFDALSVLEFRAQPSSPVEWLAVFVRYKGLQDFQVRPMAKSEDGSYLWTFDTSALPDDYLEYYLAAGTAEGIVTFPASGPSQPIRVKAKGAGPSPEIPTDIVTPQEEVPPAAAAEPGLPFPIKVSGSGQAVIVEQPPAPDTEKFPLAGNVRFFLTPPALGIFNFNLDTNFNYSNTPLAGDRPFDLSNLNLALSVSGHTLRAGDITLDESEYSIQGFGRRGLEYAFDNQRAYFHFFTVNSQEVKGFKGFGWPRSEAALLGGAAGYRILGEALFLKALFISGKDNPSLGVNVGMPEEMPSYAGRQGRVLAVTEETRLWSNLLSLKGEFALCRYDADLSDTAGPVLGNAFTLGTGLNSGVLTAGLTYRYVGRDFNSVGLPFLANNRRGLEAMLGLTRDILSLTGSLVTQRDNVNDDPSSATTSNLDGSLNLSLAVTPQAQVVLGYRLGRQNTDPGSSSALLQDSATNEFSGSFSLMVGESSSFSLSALSSQIKSEASPETGGSSFTLNLAGNLRAGDWLNLSPTFGVSTQKQALSANRTDTLSVAAVGEIFLLPQAWSMFLSGSFSLTKMPGTGGVDATALDLNSGFNVYLNRLLKVEGLLLAIKGGFTANESLGIRSTIWRALAQCDLSF